MKNDPDLLASAKLGFIGEVEPEGCFSSPVWLAFRAGAALSKHGVTEPARAAMSRGCSVRIETVGGMEFVVKMSGDHLDRTDIQRINY